MSDGEVRLTGRLICASQDEADVVRTHLPEHVRLTRAEPGCFSFVVEATADPMIWSVAEHFQDKAAFAHHQSRTAVSAWAAATAGIKRDFQIFGLD